MKTLHVIRNSGPNGITRELDLLLPATSRRTPKPDVYVCCLDGRRWLDPRPLWQLTATIREFQPDLIHTWGRPSLRAVRLAAPKTNAEIVVRKPFPSERPLTFLDHWLLRGVDRILASGEAEAARCAEAGVRAGKLRIVPPGVRIGPKVNADVIPRIVCAGALQPHKGFYEAIWAFDMLRFLDDHVELVIAGEGPERRRLDKFAERTGLRGRIQLAGQVADIGPLLARASLAWVPSLTDTGAGFALEAMAAGLPVIASRVSALAEIVVEGATGFLIEPGNKMELARQTRRLLEDPELGRKMGAAGRTRAESAFSARSFVDAWRTATGHKPHTIVGDFYCHPAVPA